MYRLAAGLFGSILVVSVFAFLVDLQGKTYRQRLNAGNRAELEKRLLASKSSSEPDRPTPGDASKEAIDDHEPSSSAPAPEEHSKEAPRPSGTRETKPEVKEEPVTPKEPEHQETPKPVEQPPPPAPVEWPSDPVPWGVDPLRLSPQDEAALGKACTTKSPRTTNY